MLLPLRMAWRNIWRNARRSCLTLAAIAFGTALLIFMVAWQSGNYRAMIDAHLQLYSGHLRVQADGYHETAEVGLALPDAEEIVGAAAALPGVTACALRAGAFSLVSSADRACGAVVVGVDPRETAFSTFPKRIRAGRYLDGGDPDGAVVGSLLAANLQLGLGDELSILGQGSDGSVAATVVAVRGIFSSGLDEYDRTIIHVPLARFQEAYAMEGAAHEVVVITASPDDLSRLKRGLAEAVGALPGREDVRVLDWMELAPGMMAAIRFDLAFWFVFYVILAVVVAFTILNTFLMAVFERTREFGVMMALGSTPARLTGLLFRESAILALLGGLAGFLLGVLVTDWFHERGIFLPGMTEWAKYHGLPNRIYPIQTASGILLGIGLVLLISLAAAAIPIGRVRRLTPVRAMQGGRRG